MSCKGNSLLTVMKLIYQPLFFLIGALLEVALGSVYPCGYGFASSVDGDYRGTNESDARPCYIHMWLRIILQSCISDLNKMYEVHSTAYTPSKFWSLHQLLVFVHKSIHLKWWEDEENNDQPFSTSFFMWQKTHICLPQWRGPWCCYLDKDCDEGEARCS